MGDLRVYPTPKELTAGAGKFIWDHLSTSAKAEGTVSFVLSGGNTPREVYRLLGTGGMKSDWSRIHFFWGDERSVGPDHPDSNYRMAREELLSAVSIPESNIHRIRTEHPADEAAASYELEIRQFFNLRPGELPAFDLILLGMGADGHVASIFPGSEAEHDELRIVTSVFAGKLGTRRVSLTLPVINNGSCVVILVSGKSKARTLRDVIEGAPGPLPAQKINPRSGNLHWLVDREAASLLHQADDL